ncbi:MAG: prolyl oligopeptidase family serine peptidase [Pseudomonadota bacterium]|uniref:alpha/beta hydrolase family protein n=1 Tax=unclassified Phenylobacterium TaxID=2640670 RepID=UPI0006FD6169|nr:MULTISPECIES: prolyl oligopeptidase family serine peptidase [unclassified Phenylobacterium]KRB42559.1 hypothetical protein ASE02_21815 [Phenylobacterium sp. Root700]MBT9471340.1 S9 family peptidase [Phenylobacterium sp.]
MRIAAIARTGLAAFALFVVGAGALADPLTLEDLLQTEEVGAVGIDPTSRWAVLERLVPYANSPRFDYDGYTSLIRSRLLRVDLTAPASPRPLFPQEPGAGYVAGPFSPDGRLILVYRLKDRRYQPGVVTLITGEVRWLPLSPDYVLYGRTAQWRSNHELVMIASADDALPVRLRLGWQSKEMAPRLWARSATGSAAAATLIGSGAFLPLRPKAVLKRLVQIDTRSGEIRTLARGDFFDLEISPDGRHAAALSDGEDLQPRSSDKVWVSMAVRRRNVTLVELDTGRTSLPCPACDLATHLLTWSPRSDALLVFNRRPGADWASGRLMVLTWRRPPRPVGGQVRPAVFYTGEGIAYVQADWMGQSPVVYGQVAGAERNDWYRLAGGAPIKLTSALAEPPPRLAAITPQHLMLVEGRQTWRIDRSGHAESLAPGPLKTVTLTGFGLGDRARINGPRHSLAFPALISTSEAPRLAWIGDSTPRRHNLTLPDANAEPLAIARGLAVISQRDRHGVQTLTLLAAGQAPQLILTLNSHLAKITPPIVRRISHRDPKGQERISWLYLPADLRPGQRRPLVVIPYPGSQRPKPPLLYGGGAAALQTHAELLTAQGYGVLLPSLPRDHHSGEPAADLADQILTIVDAAVASGGVDPDRLAIWGHSFGGYGALTVATQTSRFKAVISAAAPSNLVSARGVFLPHNRMLPEDGYELTSGMGWAEMGQAGLGTTPWSDPKRYVRNSPVFAADKITAPVLLIHGDQDIVSLTQSQEMFGALYRQHKDAEMLTFWGEGHVIGSPPNLRRLYDEVFNFLDRTVGAPDR